MRRIEFPQRDLSIIVPMHNVANYLDRCMRSLLSQSGINSEIILVEDHSEDDSADIAKQYVDSYSNVQLILSNQSGVSAARNVGLDHAKGTYVTFVDSDDWVQENSYGEIITKMKVHDYDVVSFKYSVVSEYHTDSSARSKDVMSPRDIPTSRFEQMLLSQGSVKGFCWNKIYKRSIIGGLRMDSNKSILEDLSFNIELIHANGQMKCADFSATVYYYFQRDDSRVHSKGPDFEYAGVLSYLQGIIYPTSKYFLEQQALLYLINQKDLMNDRQYHETARKLHFTSCWQVVVHTLFRTPIKVSCNLIFKSAGLRKINENGEEMYR